MSPHEKGGEREDAQKVIEPHPSTLFMTFLATEHRTTIKYRLLRNKDVGMGLNDFLSLCRHPLCSSSF